MLIHHIKQLDERTLANQVYKEQIKYDWPGLASECKEICDRLNIDNVNVTECPKDEYKKWIVKNCRREDELAMREKMEGKTKTKDLVTESFQIKKYFKEKSLSRTRELFRIRTNMYELKGNFKGNVKKEPNGSMCVACGLDDEVNSHVMKCEEYADLRRDKDLSSNMDLVDYFREVMRRRDKKMNRI